MTNIEYKVGDGFADLVITTVCDRRRFILQFMTKQSSFKLQVQTLLQIRQTRRGKYKDPVFKILWQIRKQLNKYLKHREYLFF